MAIIQKKIVILNASSAVVQVVTTGFLYFFLYKFLIAQLGVKQLGIWSLVVSSTSIANLANFGITSSLVKFVAEYTFKQKKDELNKLIFTALVSIIGFFTVLILIIYIALYFFLEKFIDPTFTNLAIRILPYSLLCLFINEVSGVFTSVLEGIQKNYLKNIIYIITSIIFLAMTYLLVPTYGLLGVVYAQVLQSILIFIIVFIVSQRFLSNTSFFVWNWDKIIFKSLISYGSKFQLVSIIQILYEPTTKVLLSKFGGLQFVGFYEMASRLVSQIRAMINSANQIMIPIVAQAAETGTNDVKDLYKKTISITLIITVPVISALVIFSGFICKFWVGYYEETFMFSIQILSLATFFNVMCAPAYFSCLGEGKLRLLIWVHISIAVLNIMLGNLLGNFWFGKGVIVAWAISLIGGSVLLVLVYQKNRFIRFHDILHKRQLLLLPCFGLVVTTLLFHKYFAQLYSFGYFILFFLIFLALSLPGFILNIRQISFNINNKN